MQMIFKSSTSAVWRVAAIAVFVFVQAAMPSFAQTPTPAPANPASPSPPTPVDLTKVPTLYEIGYSHLDTEWCWTYPQVINEFVKNTLDENFALFDKYPDYVFNWTGANRYKFIKEYYPDRYAKLKKYVAQGRWVNTGSSLEEGDVCIPSEESIIRHVLYGNEFFKKEFNSASTDFILPDCFGFPASLPSILAHCGLNGFSTQKLSWGSGERTMGVDGIPFNLGVWVGPDNRSVFAELNGDGYGSPISGDASKDQGMLSRLTKNGETTGFFADYNYYGVGDRGGSVRDSDAANLELSLHSNGPIHVVSARSDQVWNDLEKYDTSTLPRYKGDLLLTGHNCGSASSQAEQKRWNHENEKLADATERASVAADWLGALPYDKDRITDAWWKFLPGQFHDLMAGTALPLAYVYSWNDEVLAMNEFAGQLQESVGGVTRGLDTEGPGVPIVVYNPISVNRQDDVEANATFPSTAPSSIEVVGPAGTVVPSQVVSRSGNNTVKVLFLASAPSIGFSTYFVRAASAPMQASELKVSTTGLENARFRVAIDSAGDVSSIYDKKAQKELLSAPLRLSFQYDNPVAWPAWNMDWDQQSAAPEGYVDGPAKISVVETGLARVAVQVDRWARGSHFVQTISLSSGQAGDRVEFSNSIDWQTKQAALMAYIPLTVSNILATYNWELGTVQRTTDTQYQFEVPAHQWFDLTNTDDSYGVSVLSGDRYGSDKPKGNLLRLTLLLTPGVRSGYTHQGTNDIGHHELSFAITGHTGNWISGGTQWTAMRFDRPLFAFQAPAHSGVLGKSFSFVNTNNSNVSVEALKQAEYSRHVIVRFNELAGKPESGILARFAASVTSAIEVNGQEVPIGPAKIVDGALSFDMLPYRPRAFEITLGAAPLHLYAPLSIPVTLAYGVNVTKPFGSAVGGTFDDSGNAIPADMLPSSIVSDGVHFNLASSDAANNAITAHGQTIELPAAPSGAKLYILAASSTDDVSAPFIVGGQTHRLNVQAWNGYIGQWDNREWGGDVPILTYDQTNPVIGLDQGFIKRDTVAWYSDHIRAADGTNQVYQYCYLFRYAIDLPSGSTSVKLPNEPSIKILAATVAVDPNAATEAAAPLYDTLVHPVNGAPRIDSQEAQDDASASVTIDAPLYFKPNAHVYYTLDGSTPTSSSAVYAQPITLTQPVTVNAAYIESNGSVEGTSSLHADVQHPSGPTVSQVYSSTPTTVLVTFSEPVSRTTAENVANYAISPADAVSSASLSPDGQTVTLTLSSPVIANENPTVTVDGVVNNVPGGLGVTGGNAIPIKSGLVYESDDVETFDGSTNGVSHDVPGFPTSGSAPWTINFFAYFDNKPNELTTIAGFGDEQDNTGTQRYIIELNGIHFWADNVDVDTNQPYDLGKWQMVTATYDGNTLVIYKNGKIIKTTQVSLKDAASTVKIGPSGPWPGAAKLDGKIAGLRIYSSALTSDQVAALTGSMP
jgi:alpha-mannosidase